MTTALSPGAARAARPCPLCGATGAPRPSAASPEPLRCDRCSLVFIDPLPAEALLASTYGAEYYEPWQGAEERPRRRMWRGRLRRLARRTAPGRLLDVGCGDGLFLSEATAAGHRATGIEFSPEGARRAAARVGGPVAVGDLATTPSLPGPFDVVTLWHVLEHLPAPRPMLRAVLARLEPGGLVAVAVPNVDNLPMRAAYRLARRRPLPLYEAGAREPHLSHFSRRTLARLLREAGFVEIEVTRDACALRPALRAIDFLAACLSALTGRLMTDALLAFARRPR